MTIKEQFIEVQTDIIRSLDNHFVGFLDANLIVTFDGNFPQPNENLLLAGTFNFQVKVNNIFYSPYSDEFFELTSSNARREYVVKYSFLHNYCFNLFCTYFEIITSNLPAYIAQKYLAEFEFLLNIQISNNNQVYQDSYGKYWREIILRTTYVLTNNGHSFYERFDNEQRQQIISDLNNIVQKL
jgi:hypothetical protein